MVRSIRPPRRRLAATLVLAVVAAVGCSGEDVDDALSTAEDIASDVTAGVDASTSDVEDDAQALATALEGAGGTTIATAVRSVDFSEVTSSDEFTFFAPSDEAFLSLTADELADLTSDSDLLVSTLQAHVVDQAVTADELTGMSEVSTVAGTSLPVEVDGDTVTVGDATVVETDITAGDGVIHVIDTLLGGE